MPAGVAAATLPEARALIQGMLSPSARGREQTGTPVRPLPGEPIRLPGGMILLLAGMGGARAKIAAARLRDCGATALVSWGFAGGLLPGFSPGTLVIPEKVLAGDGSVYFVDLSWRKEVECALEGAVDLRGGTLAESPRVVAGPAEKERFLRRTGAAAVDMESAPLARAAMEMKVPFLALRAITDGASSAIPRCALDSADGYGRVRIFKLLAGIGRRPGEALDLLRLARGVRGAEAALARAALAAGELLSRPPALSPAGESENESRVAILPCTTSREETS